MSAGAGPVDDADGRAARVDRLVRAAAPALLRYFERRVQPVDDAADLLGETLLVLWRRVDAVPRDDEQARMWMFGIAQRVLRQHRRGTGRRIELADRLRERLGGTQLEDGAAALADREQLAAALASLDERDREIIRLVAWDGFALAEAARLLRMRPGSVRSRYSRARAALRAALAADAAAAEADPALLSRPVPGR